MSGLFGGGGGAAPAKKYGGKSVDYTGIEPPRPKGGKAKKVVQSGRGRTGPVRTALGGSRA